MGRHSILSLLVLLLSLSWGCVKAQESVQVSKTFTACALNIDGLPQKMAGITVNGDGPGSEGTEAIGKYIVNKGIDIVGCSEDFNYNGDLVVGLGGNYQMGLWRGRIDISAITSILGSNPVDTDGLMFLLRNTNKEDGKAMSFYDESWTQWNEALGGLDAGANTLVKKGYRFYTVNIGEGVKIDVYVLHMNTAENADQIAVQDRQLTQLAEAIKANTDGRPKLIIGDTNCRYTRNKVTDNLITPLSELYTIKDVWVEKFQNGTAPTYTPDVDDDIVVSDKTNSKAYETGEIVDKIFYLVPKGSSLSITLDDLVFDADNYKKKDGNLLGDHVPVIAKFTISGTISTNDFNPASQSAFWEGETLSSVASTTDANAYIYNVGSKTFITNNTASVTDINSAVKWRVTPDNGTYTFFRLDESNNEWRIQMKSTGTKVLKATKGATDFTIRESTSTVGAYKFVNNYYVALEGNIDHYFNVDGTQYTGAQTMSSNNDWLFISEAQKTAYNNYKEAYDKAKALLTEKEDYLNSEPALKSELEDILLETIDTRYSNSAENTEKLNDIINRINNPWSFTKKITVGAKYATICLPYNTRVPEGVSVMVVTQYNSDAHYVKTAEFANAGDIMPANNGFLLYAPQITADTEYTFVYTSNAASAPGVNLLYGNVERSTDTDNLKDVFVLANKSNGVGFYHLQRGQALAANVAYLRIANSESIDATAKVFIEDSTTGVDAVETETNVATKAVIYDIQGRQTNTMRRGVNIVRMSDGSVRKVIVK